MIRLSAATRRGRAGGSASERDDVMGSGPRVPSGGRDAPDCMENFGAERYIREGKEDPHTNDGREECLSSGLGDPTGAVNCGYVLWDYLFIDIRGGVARGGGG